MSDSTRTDRATVIDDLSLGALLERISDVERLARQLCLNALTTHPELREHTLPLEMAIRHLDKHPAIAALRKPEAKSS